MFTGIVEELGRVRQLEAAADAARLTVAAGGTLEGVRSGASIAVDGCCLTVVDRGDDWFTADVMRETLTRTTLGSRAPGDAVNLERAVPAGGRLDGHIVQGHVDGTGRVLGRTSTPRWDVVRVGLGEDLLRYVAVKGSIAVDGVSLTVVEVSDGPEPAFTVSLIPETLTRTTLGHRAVGAAVNLEVDVLAKYLERLVSAGRADR